MSGGTIAKNSILPNDSFCSAYETSNRSRLARKAKHLVALTRLSSYKLAMDLSLEKLKEAVSIREQIQSLEDRLGSLFGAGGQRPRRASTSFSSSSTASSAGAKQNGRRRPMSAATRAKLAAAARARWANARGSGARTLGSTTASSGSNASGAKRSSSSGAKKSGISAAGRRRLSEAMKARWAARRAGR